jgi:hypothetical protein
MENAVERGLDWAGMPVIATVARALCQDRHRGSAHHTAYGTEPAGQAYNALRTVPPAPNTRIWSCRAPDGVCGTRNRTLRRCARPPELCQSTREGG